MDYAGLAVDQITDPFRIGLLLALLLTTARTAGQTGRVLPLALGIVFVAVLIPSTFGAQRGEAWWPTVLVGIAVNTAVVAVALGIQAGLARSRRRGGGR